MCDNELPFALPSPVWTIRQRRISSVFFLNFEKVIQVVKFGVAKNEGGKIKFTTFMTTNYHLF